MNLDFGKNFARTASPSDAPPITMVDFMTNVTDGKGKSFDTGSGAAPSRASLGEGPVRSLAVPGWKRTDEQDDVGKLTQFAPDGDATKMELSLYEPRREINDKSMATYRAMLEKAADQKGTRVLLPNEIRQLDCVMGLTKQGDNQFTNTVPYPDQRAPAFYLSSAQFINVNGKELLEVQGRFVDSEKNPTNYFRGVFIPSEDKSHITKLFAQSPNQADFAKGESAYRKALQSIEWR